MKLTNAERKAIYRRDGYACGACGNHSYLQIHHIVPRGKGGSNHPHNLITLCDKCHALVHGIITEPWFEMEDFTYCVAEYMSDYYMEREGEFWNPYYENGARPDKVGHRYPENDRAWNKFYGKGF